jgi:hypothetical protein
MNTPITIVDDQDRIWHFDASSVICVLERPRDVWEIANDMFPLTVSIHNDAFKVTLSGQNRLEFMTLVRGNPTFRKFESATLPTA